MAFQDSDRSIKGKPADEDWLKEVPLSSLRRHPLRRGARRISALLDACEALLETIPFDQITVTMIAARAQIPVGTVYFFFGDRTAIFLCLIERVTLQIRREYELTDKRLALPIGRYILDLERRLQKIWVDHRAMMDLYLTYRRHAKVAPILDEFNEFVTNGLERRLALEFPELSPRRRAGAAEVINKAVTHMLDVMAYMPPAVAKGYRSEWLRMLQQYLTILPSSLGSR